MSTKASLDDNRSAVHKYYFGNPESTKKALYTSNNTTGATYYNTNAPIDKVRQAMVAPTITTCNIAK